MCQYNEKNEPEIDIERDTRTNYRLRSRADKAPKWLDKEQLGRWTVLPKWRSVFRHEQSYIHRTFILYTIRSSGIAIGISIITAILVWRFISSSYFTPSTMVSIANICCVSAASITAIVLAFVVFLIGRAESVEQQTQDNIRHEVDKLEFVRGEIENFVDVDVQETVTDPVMIDKVKTLADTTNKFDAALHDLIRLFRIAIDSRGTFYDYHDPSMVFLPDHLSAKGGDWFVAYAKLFNSLDSRNFARRVWDDAIRASSNLVRLNNYIKVAEDQRQEALQVSRALPSLFLIVFLSLVALFTINVFTITSEISRFIIIFLSTTLILLLSTQILLLIYWVYQHIYREMIIRVANREFGREFSKKYARVNKEEMIKDSVERTLKYSIDK